MGIPVILQSSIPNKIICELDVNVEKNITRDVIDIKFQDLNSGYTVVKTIYLNYLRKYMKSAILEQMSIETVKEILLYKVSDIVELKKENKELKKELKKQSETKPKLNRKAKRKIVVRK